MTSFRCFHCESFVSKGKAKCGRCGAQYLAPKAKPQNDGTRTSWAHMGAYARAQSLTPERRREIAKMASDARWKGKT